MNSNLKNLFRLDVVFNILGVYLNIMINYYFWQTSKSLETVMLYNLFYSVFGFSSYVLGSYLLFKSVKRIYFTSAGSAVVLSVILFFADSLPYYLMMALVAFFASLVVAVFYSGTNYLISCYTETKQETRVYFNRIALYNNFIFILVPIINGLLIECFGFQISFVFLGVVSVIYLVFVFKLKDNHLAYERNFFSFMKAESKTTYFSKSVFKFIFIGGMGCQMIVTLQPTVMSAVSQNSIELSLMNTVVVFVLILSYLLVKKHSKKKNTVWYNIFLVLFVAANVGLFLPTTLNNYIYLILLSMGMYMFKYIFNVYPFEELDGLGTVKKQMLLLKREWYLFVGRMIMLTVAYLLIEDVGDLNWIFLNGLVLFICGVVWFIIRKIEKERDLKFKG